MPTSVESDRALCYQRMRFPSFRPMRVHESRCNPEVCLGTPYRNEKGGRRRPRLGFIFLSSVLSLVSLSLSAKGGGAKKKKQPPTARGAKDPAPNHPPINKQAETPPPAPAVSPASLPSSLTLEQAINYALQLQPQ